MSRRTHVPVFAPFTAMRYVDRLGMFAYYKSKANYPCRSSFASAVRVSQDAAMRLRFDCQSTRVSFLNLFGHRL